MPKERVMNDHEFDRILSRDAELVPSFGFASSVMDAVRSQASAPPPIPFPWKRALPGIAAFVVALTYLIVGTFRQSAPSVPSPSVLGDLFSSLNAAVHAALMAGAGWIVAGLLLAYVSVKLSLLFAQRKV
jgi:hypothetical protein